MLESLDFSAIMWGFAAAVVLGILSGLIFGAAMAVDSGDSEGRPWSDSEQEMDAQLEADMNRRPVLAQMIVLSLATAALSGAVTGWLADSAPLLNAAILGVISTILGLALARSTPYMPRTLHLAGALGTLPATLLGAWVMYI